jgi:hypothetical protein
MHPISFLRNKHQSVACFRQSGNLGKAARIGYGKVSQNLPVNFNFGSFQAVNELAVRKPVSPGSSVYASNPQRSEISFLDTPVSECIVQGPVNRLGGTSEQLAPGTSVPFGQLQYFVSSLSRFKSSFYSRHRLLLLLDICRIRKGRHSSRFSDLNTGRNYIRPDFVIYRE